MSENITWHDRPQSSTPNQFTPTAMQHQLTHNQLVNFLRDEVGKAGTSTTAVLIMKLKRAKHLDAIIGDTSTPSIMDYIDQHLDSLLRDADRYAHFFDEQICLVLPGLANNAQSILAAIKILSELHKPFIADDYPVMLRPHIGIANFPELGRDAGQLLMYADIASDIAATNEEGYHVYQPDDRIETEAYSGLDIELGKAIKANELHVHYQPQVNIQTGRCVSIEALVRCQRQIEMSAFLQNRNVRFTLYSRCYKVAHRPSLASLPIGLFLQG